MKYILYILSFSLIFFSCEDDYSDEKGLNSDFTKEKTTVTSQTFDSEIKGVISGASGKTLRTFYVEDAKMKEGKSIILDEEGSFVIPFNIKELNLLQLVIDNESLALAFDKSEAIPFVTSSFPQFDYNFKINNSQSAANLQAYYTEVRAEKNFVKTRGASLQSMGQIKSPEDSLYRIQTIDSLYIKVDQIQKIARKYISLDFGSPINQIIVTDIYPQYGFQKWDRENLVVANSLTVAYETKYPNSDFTSKMKMDASSWTNQLAAYDKFEKRNKQYGDFSQKIEVGEKAPDIFMDDVNGTELKLSSLKGKVVLLDFWASWCGPCRKANPHVVSLYTKYKDNGFTVYSVSLDKEEAKWKQAIQDDGLVWPNHVSDLSGWNTPMVKLYKFRGIPFTVLIDKNGKIAGVNIPTQELEQKLQSLL